MESRLRKFLSPRKIKARRSDVNAELDLHSIPYKTASPQGRLPVFISQALGKSAADKQPERHAPSDHLRSFSYDEAEPGKPPQLGHRPQRGNGPIKLQTSRRLSSGELLVTDQDYERTLEEIREGEYVVGGKEGRISKTVSQPKSLTEPANLKFTSTAPSSPREQYAFSSAIWHPPSIHSDVGPLLSPASTSSIFNPPQRAFSAQAYYPDYPQHLSSPGGLGISTPVQQFYPSHMASTTSLLEPHEEQNPTIQALWKAEYSRLVSIYGQTGVDQTVVDLNRDRSNVPPPNELVVHHQRSYSNSSQPSSSPNYLLPSPVRSPPVLRMNASTSNLGLAYCDDRSEELSQLRYSQLSSSGTASSFTTHTSAMEQTNTTREDIRKIIDSMRTNYLHAIESQTLPLQPLPSPHLQKHRSKKEIPSLMSYASVDSSLRSTSQRAAMRSKSWQSNITHTTHLSTPRTSVSSVPVKSRRPGSGTSRRTSGPHAAGMATLTPIEASPAKPVKSRRSKKQNDDQGLKRADSTTLGGMAEKLTVVDDRYSSGSSQATYKSLPTFYHSSGSESEHGTASTSPAPSPRRSPIKPSSVQHTPEKQKLSVPPHNHSPLSEQPWQIDIDGLLRDGDDLDLILDVDDFETLCDGIFNSHPTGNDNKFGRFQTWDDLESALAKDSFDITERHSLSINGCPAELRTSKVADTQIGLGLGGLPTMF